MPRPHLVSDSYEAPSTGPLDGRPRPRSDPHEARSPTGGTPPRVSPGRGARSPLSPPTTGQNSWHLIQPPTPTYRHGRSLGRRGNNTSVSPHCFTAHPVMGGEKRHCDHRTSPYASLLTLEGGYDKARTPRFQGFGLIRSASTRPRRLIQYNREGRHGTALRVISASRPLYLHGVQGWPPISRARRYSHLNRDRQNIISRLPVVLASSRSIKRQAGALQGEQKTTDGQPAIYKIEINISSNHLVFLSFSFETWARRPLSQACNPYTSTSVQGNTKSPLPRWT
jgi:hypothetical protein